MILQRSKNLENIYFYLTANGIAPNEFSITEKWNWEACFWLLRGYMRLWKKNSSCVLAIGPGKYTREINY